MQTLIVGNPINKQRGFSYVLVLIAVITTGIMMDVASEPASRRMQAEREQELLFRGMAYQRAIKNYYWDNHRYPSRLSDLVKDPGFAHRVYIRDLYSDPVSADHKGEWKIIRASDGGIAGVSSQSLALPMKQANFPLGFEQLENSSRYSDWKFIYLPSKPKMLPKG